MKHYRKPQTAEFQTDIDMLIEECLGIPMGDELPQVATTDETVIGLYQEMTNMPHAYIESYLHHQMDDEITIH